MSKPAINRTLKQVERVLLTLGERIEEKGAGADKTKSYAALVNQYNKLLITKDMLKIPRHLR